MVVHREALAALKRDMADLKAGAGAGVVRVGQFKERYGVTRKFAIRCSIPGPGTVTRRVGDARILL